MTILYILLNDLSIQIQNKIGIGENMKIFDNNSIDVVCSIIFGDTPDKVLVGKRSDTKLWELPGGTVEEGETLDEAIKRELKEELDVEVGSCNFVGTEVKYIGNKTINLYIFATRLYGNEGTPKVMNEHDEIRWITIDEIDHLEWIESDYVLGMLRHMMKGISE